jgi:hypothetical protein
VASAPDPKAKVLAELREDAMKLLLLEVVTLDYNPVCVTPM